MKKNLLKGIKKGGCLKSIKVIVKCCCTDRHRIGEGSFQVLHLGNNSVDKVLVFEL